MSPHELIVDSFAGGGGASLGIQWALGRSPDIAINHDPEAIALHKANHPDSQHYAEDVWKVDPVKACAGRPVGLMWLSPDCKHFSKAKGSKPVSKKIRGLAWVAHRWAKAVRPRVICLENVEEFQTWGPCIKGPDGKWYPCPARKGLTFRRFVGRLRNLGYQVEWRELRGCDFGAPTIRKRLFLVARCDGQPVVWPTPTHGKGLARPWRTSAEIIDWSIPCPSIFLTKAEARALGLKIKRPLVRATLRRVAKGVYRFVIDNPRPFIVNMSHGGKLEDLSHPLSTIATEKGGCRAIAVPYLARTAHGDQDKTGKRRGKGEHSLQEPLPTVLGSQDLAVVAPTLIQTGYGEREGQQPRVPGLDKPLGTVVAAGGKHALVAAFLAQHNAGFYEGAGRQAELPLSTITHRGTQQQIVAATLVSLHGTTEHHLGGRSIEEPLASIAAGGMHAAEVRVFLMKYYGTDQDPRLELPLHTVTTKERFAIVYVYGEQYVIVDIGMRMLVPRELYRAQGFPDTYVIEVLYQKPGAKRARRLSNTAQVKMCGNSVNPDVAAALVRAQFGLVATEAAA